MFFRNQILKQMFRLTSKIDRYSLSPSSFSLLSLPLSACVCCLVGSLLNYVSLFFSSCLAVIAALFDFHAERINCTLYHQLLVQLSAITTREEKRRPSQSDVGLCLFECVCIDFERKLNRNKINGKEVLVVVRVRHVYVKRGRERKRRERKRREKERELREMSVTNQEGNCFFSDSYFHDFCCAHSSLSLFSSCFIEHEFFLT